MAVAIYRLVILMRYYPGIGLARNGESYADLRKRRAEALRHNRRVERLQTHFEQQRKRPMESMVSWAQERGIFEDNAKCAGNAGDGTKNHE